MASPSPPEKPRGWPATPTGPALRRPSRGRDPSAAERGSLPTRSSTVGEARLSRAAAAPGAALDARTTGYVTVPTAESEGKAEVRGASAGAKEEVSQRERKSWRSAGPAGGDRPGRGLGDSFPAGDHGRTRSPRTKDKKREQRRGRKTKSERGMGEGAARKRAAVAAA